jgi:hypothetical protein
VTASTGEYAGDAGGLAGHSGGNASTDAPSVLAVLDYDG